MRWLAGWVCAAWLCGCPAAGESAARASSPAAKAQVRSSDPSAESYVGPALPKARVVLKDAFGGAHPVDVEVAASSASRQRGLMWRSALEEGKGMLFIFPAEEEQNFWMKNTLIPLDMVFIGKNLRVNGVVRRAVPGDLSARGIGKPGVYVLEVPGGWTEKIGLVVGSQIELFGTSMIPIES